MAIYRGNGGAGDATGGVTLNTITELTLDAENSATAAATSASNAATSATSAANSASAASTSATNSSNSATAAATSATNSANSATASASSASAAASSASAAASSATDAETAQTAAEAAESNASTSASAAASSASSASSSASTATTQATNAASSASAAATSATNAANSATTASGYVSDAADQVTLATTQATNAANSATAASTSASSAASSAAAAAASLDSFDDRYLGAKSSAPTLDNDGNALITGALYYDTTEGLMFVYDGGQWIAASSASQAILTVYKYTATSGQTTFSGADDNAATLGYTVGSIIVTLNGVFLEGGDDYTATDGSSVVLSAGATTSDEVNIYSFNTFDVANVQVIGDERYVRLSTDQTVAGTKTLSSNPVLSAGTANGVTYLNGSKVLTSGSALTFDGSTLTTTAGIEGTKLTTAGNISLYNSVSSQLTHYQQLSSAYTASYIQSALSGASSSLVFAVNSNWTNSNAVEAMRLTSTSLYTASGISVGIGVSLPAQTLHVKPSTSATPITLGVLSNATTIPALSFNGAYASTTMAGTYQTSTNLYTTVPATGYHYWAIADSTKMTLDSAGNLGLGVTPSGWRSIDKAFDVGDTISLYYQAGDLGGITHNHYLNSSGNRVYKKNGYANMYLIGNGGNHAWYTAPSGTAGNAISFTQAMTLDDNGNLGIGATSLPSYARLHVSGTAGDQTGASQQLVINAPTTTSGHGAGIRLNAASGAKEAVGIIGVVNEASGNAGAMTFHLYNGGGNVPERVRIDSSGNLLVGTTGASVSPAHHLVQAGNELNLAGAIASSTLYFNYRSGTTLTDLRFMSGSGSSTYVACYGTSFTNSSDYRIKTDVQEVGSVLEKVVQLRPLNYIKEGVVGREFGLIAHEAQAVFPDIVSGEKDAVDEDGDMEIQGIDYAQLSTILVKAIQEQQAIIDEQKTALEALTARVSALEGN